MRWTAKCKVEDRAWKPSRGQKTGKKRSSSLRRRLAKHTQGRLATLDSRDAENGFDEQVEEEIMRTKLATTTTGRSVTRLQRGSSCSNTNARFVLSPFCFVHDWMVLSPLFCFPIMLGRLMLCLCSCLGSLPSPIPSPSPHLHTTPQNTTPHHRIHHHHHPSRFSQACPFLVVSF